MSNPSDQTPKEGRFTKNKNLKTDNILETRELLKKLERMAYDMRRMSPEDLENFWPQSSENKKKKNEKQNEKDFLISMILEAQRSVQTVTAFARYGIDLNDSFTQDLVTQQASQVRGH